MFNGVNQVAEMYIFSATQCFMVKNWLKNYNCHSTKPTFYKVMNNLKKKKKNHLFSRYATFAQYL